MFTDQKLKVLQEIPVHFHKSETL